MFNKEGQKVMAFYATKKGILGSIKRFIIISIKAKFGNFRPTPTYGSHKNAFYSNILCPKTIQKVPKRLLDWASNYFGLYGTNNLFSTKQINHNRPKLTKFSLFSLLIKVSHTKF